jgi:hypothetical protein
MKAATKNTLLVSMESVMSILLPQVYEVVVKLAASLRMSV